jgi:hypothetical protein
MRNPIIRVPLFLGGKRQEPRCAPAQARIGEDSVTPIRNSVARQHALAENFRSGDRCMLRDRRFTRDKFAVTEVTNIRVPRRSR